MCRCLAMLPHPITATLTFAMSPFLLCWFISCMEQGAPPHPRRGAPLLLLRPAPHLVGENYTHHISPRVSLGMTCFKFSTALWKPSSMDRREIGRASCRER